jgi:hypothetical protein
MKHEVTGMTVVEYVAPPPPPVPEGDKVIEIPEQEGTPVTVLTVENGMTIYLHRERHDVTAADHYAKAVGDWLNLGAPGGFIGLPSAQNPDAWCWISEHTCRTCMHFHDATVLSPLAVQKRAGQRIIVPMGDGQIEIPGHGPGKRKR